MYITTTKALKGPCSTVTIGIVKTPKLCCFLLEKKKENIRDEIQRHSSIFNV